VISAENISDLIKNPQLVEQFDVNDIAVIRDKFSYCSTLHLLYLKGLALTNAIDFEDELRYAAAHVMDRERMYYLIHSTGEIQKEEISKEEIQISESSTSLRQLADTVDKKIPKEKIPEKEIEEKEIEEKQISNSKSSTFAKAEVDKIPKEDLVKEIEQKENREVIPGDKIESGTVAEIVKSSDSNVAEEKNKVSDELIESTILPTIVEAVFERELNSTPDISEEKIIKQSEEKYIISSGIVDNQKTEKSLPEKTGSPADKTEIDLSKLSFVEWLKYKQRHPEKTIEKIETPIVVTSERKDSVIASEKIKSETPIEKITEIQKKGNNKKALSKTEVDALLNKFISEEPSISRPKSEFFSPTKSAKQSLEESTDLVTETLAKIYYLQKNYAKAIKAYEQLSLVYPEKKTFFASQIEKIKIEQHK